MEVVPVVVGTLGTECVNVGIFGKDWSGALLGMPRILRSVLDIKET